MTTGMTPTELEAALKGLGAGSQGWALACCGWDRAEAEEVLQIAALKLLEGRARFGARSSFRAFWFGVVRRTASERRRRERMRRLLGDGGRQLIHASDDGPELAADQAREIARLRTALAGLPQRQREVLHLVFYSECTIEEAAHAMGVRLGTARTHYARGKRRLREQLAIPEEA